MHRNHILSLSVTLCLAILMAGCGAPATASNVVKILPDLCEVQVGKQIPLALDGVIPPNATIQWEVSEGSVVFTSPGLNAYFTAPSTPTVVTISVSISSGTPGVDTPITRQCSILAEPGTVSQQPPTTNGGLLSQVMPAIQSVIISEVMAFPCGSLDFKKWNQYVELYNPTDQPVDVRGLWLHDGGDTGSPDQIVAWSDRQPRVSLGDHVVTNTTVLPAHAFAVILSPIYAQGEQPYHMPYQFPSGTIILTIAASDSLGDDYFNINGDGDGRDPVVLYSGSASVIDTVISTYGSPVLGTYVVETHDDRRDNIPLDLHACGSAERVFPTGPDTFDNWHEVSGGSPGDAPY